MTPKRPSASRLDELRVLAVCSGAGDATSIENLRVLLAEIDALTAVNAKQATAFQTLVESEAQVEAERDALIAERDGLKAELEAAKNGNMSLATIEQTAPDSSRIVVSEPVAKIIEGFCKEVKRLESDLSAAMAAKEAAEKERDRLKRLLDTPEVDDFVDAVKREAAHQCERWGVDSDAGKTPQDWFWLIGYLAGKGLNAAITGDRDKALHHTVSTAAACLNWHAHMTGHRTAMRPGTDQAALKEPHE